MKKLIIYMGFMVSILGFSQNSDLSKLLKKHNTETIPYITVETLKNEKSQIYLLDAREENEYKTSHLKNAIPIGCNHFKLENIQNIIPKKTSKIVVYCSIGIRSETIALKLKKAGYTNVYNLYGGIFEWKNKNNPVYNSQDIETDNVHTFSKKWSKWLTKGVKIYE